MEVAAAQPDSEAVNMETDAPAATTSEDKKLADDATATPTPGNKANRKRKKNKVKVGLPSKILETVTNKLRSCKKGEELEVLMNVLQPTINELVNKYSSIKKDLEVIMTQLSPFYDVLVFGSAVTGLAFRDSDFDFHINCGPVTKKDTPVVLINKLANAISKSGESGFRQPVRITGARVPILRVIHVKTGIVCDINFSNSMGVHNSAFLNFVLNFDHRIHPLAIIIKFWTRCQGAGFKQLNSYCIVNMLIYYLQQLKLPMLPPIILFQRNLPENQLGAWNFAYNTNFRNLSQNKSDVTDLLIGFFKFYSTFEYDRFVISPLYGKLYPRHQFENNFFEDNEHARYKYAIEHMCYEPLPIKSALCIQDPFELNANIGKAVQPTTLEHWKAYTKYASKTCEQFRQQNRGAGPAGLLIKLFTETPSIKAGAGSSLPPKQAHLTTHGNNLLDAIEKCAQYSETSTEYVLRLTPLGLETYVIKQTLLKQFAATDPKRILTQPEINQYWAESFIKFLTEQFFVKFFGFEVKKEEYKASGLPKTNYSTATKTDEEQTKEALAKAKVASASESSQHVQLFTVKGEHDTWSGRRKIAFNDAASFQKECDAAKVVVEASQSRPSLTVINTFLKIVCGEKYEFVSLEFHDCVGLRKRSGLKTFFKNSLMRDARQSLKAYLQLLQQELAKIQNGDAGAVAMDCK